MLQRLFVLRKHQWLAVEQTFSIQTFTTRYVACWELLPLEGTVTSKSFSLVFLDHVRNPEHRERHQSRDDAPRGVRKGRVRRVDEDFTCHRRI